MLLFTVTLFLDRKIISQYLIFRFPYIQLCAVFKKRLSPQFVRTLNTACHSNRSTQLTMNHVVKARVPPEIVFVLGTHREQKRNKHEIYMPNTNPTLAYPMQTIFHCLALGLFGYQHVGIGLLWGPMREGSRSGGIWALEYWECINVFHPIFCFVVQLNTRVC